MNYGLREPLAPKIPRQATGVPTAVYLQLSDRCNHLCRHCYQVHGRRSEMSTSEVKAVLGDLASSGVLFLTLTGGEVTLRPDLLEIVAHARALKFAVKVYTNGYLVDDELARRLAELAVLEVHVSVYSAVPGVHDAVTRVPGSHDRTLEGLRSLRRAGLHVVLKFPFMLVNEGSYRDLVDLAGSLGCDYTIDSALDVREDGCLDNRALRPTDAALQRLFADMSVQNGAVTLPRERRLSDNPCGACDFAYIEPDGTIRPCAALPFAIGDARSLRFRETYENGPVVSFVRSLTWDNLPGCRLCELRPSCQRCHATALLEDGDLFGPSRGACQGARARYRVHIGAEATADDPDRGPYEITGEGRLRTRVYGSANQRIPDDVPIASVRAMGDPGSRRAHLPALRAGSTATGRVHPVRGT